MNAHSESLGVVSITGASPDVCHDDFPLSRVQRGALDKLGNRIVEVLWLSPDYAIYRTSKGVFIHFSDCPAKAAEQREAFTAICAELCELRYLTTEMHGTRMRPMRRLLSWFASKRSDDGFSLFDHNIAQSLMLLMEGKREEAKAIATSALEMAVTRSTNDNTIRYLRGSVYSGLFLALLITCALAASSWTMVLDQLSPFFVAGYFGLLGAAFSIITRIQSFEMKPCQQSNMNGWMALIRMLIGLIGGMAFFLLANSKLGAALVNPEIIRDWQGVALIGFFGGFAERMVQSVFRRTAAGFEARTGTPVQRARDHAKTSQVSVFQPRLEAPTLIPSKA